jgi:DNA-binding PucR family transcriptional regulator
VILSFDRSLIYHLISAGADSEREAYAPSFLFRSLELLREYGRLHQADILRILREYFENDRKATVVSRLLHLHRNTILYHVEKAEALLGVSFDDPDTRLKLLLAFKNSDFTR